METQPSPNIEQILSPYHIAVQESKKTKSPKEIGNHLVNLGIVQFSLQDFKNGMDSFDQAIQIARDDHDTEAEAVFLGKKGLTVWEVKQFPNAMECFNDVLKIAEENKYSALQCDALGNIGMLMLDTGDPSQSVMRLKEALSIADTIGDKHRQIIYWGGLGNAYLEVSNIEHAVQCFNEALELSREVGDRQAEAGYLNNLGIIYTQQNDPNKSIRYFEQGLRLVKESGDLDAELNVISLLIQAYQKQNQIDIVVQLLDRAIELTENVEKREDRNEFLEELIPILLFKTKNQEAVSAINKLLPDLEDEVHNQKRLHYLISLGQAHLELEALEQAIKIYEKAFDLSVRTADEKSEALILGRLATIQAELGNYEVSNDIINKSLTIAKKFNNHILLSELHCIQAMNFRDLNQKPAAIEAINNAISILDKKQDAKSYSLAVELMAEIKSIA